MDSTQLFKNLQQELDIKVSTFVDQLADRCIDKFKSNIDATDKHSNPFPTGDLKNGYYKNVINSYTVDIVNDVPYAAIQNYGGEIQYTEKMRKFFWARFYETGDPLYKSLALSKKPTITIPKRDFNDISNL